MTFYVSWFTTLRVTGRHSVPLPDRLTTPYVIRKSSIVRAARGVRIYGAKVTMSVLMIFIHRRVVQLLVSKTDLTVHGRMLGC